MIIAVANQKGGVGKSTTAHALGAGLHYAGNRVLFVDLDAQGNLTYALGANPALPGSYELLTRAADAKAAVQRAGGFDVICSSPALHGADMELTETGKEFRLREGLSAIAKDYDDILIDTPPALGTLTVNALTAADALVIPAQADVFSLQGVGQLHRTIEAVKRYCNPNLRVLGILLTRFQARSVLSRDMLALMQDAAAQMNTRVFEAAIRENIAAREAAANRQDIFAYAPKSNAAQDYEALIDEIMADRQKGA